MPFVKRDADGKITAVHMEAREDGLEEVSADDPEVSDFLYLKHSEKQDGEEWLNSDLALSRVLEDLIDLLIAKKYIMFTDLPAAAQQKLIGRRGLRKEFAYVETLFSTDDEDDLPGDGEGGDFL
ncbi:MAG: hypothetical protein V3V55_04280 [Rhodospirillales bacterium]